MRQQGTSKKPTGAAQAVALLLALAASGCGTSDAGGEDPTMDDRYQECLDRGGSFTGDDVDDEWSCDQPATVTPTEEP